jgi:hypothetical protein
VTNTDLVGDYLRLGLALGRHIEGFVDSYYGPPELASQAAAGSPISPASLREDARRLRAGLASDGELEPERRQWLSAQARGLHMTARKLTGESVNYLDEIEECYGARPRFVPEEDLADGHAKLDAALPGSGSIPERYIAWREGQVVPPDKLASAVASLAEDLRARTRDEFGLPEEESVDFEMVTNKPWRGFNYYLGGFASRVAVNTDVPVLATEIGGLVAHEAYPGHHTEHCRKEAGLVRHRQRMEESIFLVGTPQCLVSEGLADLGLEVIAGSHPQRMVAEHLRPLGVPYDADLAEEISDTAQMLRAARGNAAILVHDRGYSADDATTYLARWGMMSRVRASKRLEFLVDPTWRAYEFCYIEGYRLCRQFVAGDPERFERLISDQLVPSQLVAA